MREHRLEVADVFREQQGAFLKRWGHTLSPQQRKALRDIGACRTAALGGHIEQCDDCPHEVIAYNSCRNRHCPKCQSTSRDRWLAERAKELLPVPYCHLIFTIPEPLKPLALQNQRLVYGLLFRAASFGENWRVREHSRRSAVNRKAKKSEVKFVWLPERYITEKTNWLRDQRVHFGKIGDAETAPSVADYSLFRWTVWVIQRSVSRCEVSPPKLVMPSGQC